MIRKEDLPEIRTKRTKDIADKLKADPRARLPLVYRWATEAEDGYIKWARMSMLEVSRVIKDRRTEDLARKRTFSARRMPEEEVLQTQRETLLKALHGDLATLKRNSGG